MELSQNVVIYITVVFLTLMMLDVVSGYVHAVITDTLQSARMRRGFWKKGAEVAYLVGGVTLDTVSRFLLTKGELPEQISETLIPLGVSGAGMYLVVMEATSVLENFKAIFDYDPTEE